MSVTKSQLSKELAERLEVRPLEASEFLDAFEYLVRKHTAEGEAVMLTGFVKFERKDRPARKGRNPATGETIQIAAKSVVKVTPLKAFKDHVLNAAKPTKSKSNKKKGK